MKKIICHNLIEYNVLSQGAVVAGVSADSTDDGIAAQDNKIIRLINNNKVHKFR